MFDGNRWNVNLCMYFEFIFFSDCVLILIVVFEKEFFNGVYFVFKGMVKRKIDFELLIEV